MGSQREGAHTVSFGPRQPGEEPQLDLLIRRGVPHPGRRCHVGGPGVARQSKGCRQSEIRLTDHGRTTVAAGDRDSAYQSAGGVRPAVQPYGCLRHSVRTPGYSTAAVVTTAVLAFGVGIAVGAAMNNSCWDGATATGTATGTAARWSTTATATTETAHGTAATMVPARPPTVRTERAGWRLPITLHRDLCARRIGLDRLWHPSGWSGVQPKHRSLCRHASSLQRLWKLRKLGCLKERQHRVHPASNYRARVCRNGTNFGGWQRCCCVGRVRQQCVPRAKPQTATSMPRQTAMSTRTPGAVGTRPRVPLTAQATQEPTLLLLAAMEGRKRAAGHRPLAEAAEAVGNPGRRVLVVRQAAVVAAAGADAGEANGPANEVNSSDPCW